MMRDIKIESLAKNYFWMNSIHLCVGHFAGVLLHSKISVG